MMKEQEEKTQTPQDLRQIIMSEDFKVFYQETTERVREKIDYISNILRTQKIVNQKFVKKLENTIFYELRISVENEYRTIVFTIDHENLIEATQILLLNSFQKKGTKDYKKALNKAHTILKDFENEPT